jgi:uncharacterized RDD family membrane protein YckC
MVKALDLIGSNSQLQNHWVRRIIAAIIDGVISLVILIIILSFGITIPAFWILGPFIPGIVWLFYSAILEGMMDATLGKRLMSLQVIATEGQMNLIKALIRNVSKIHVIFILADWLVGFITEGDPRQRYLDRIADTTVVRTDAQEIFLGAYQPPAGPMPAPIQPSSEVPQYPSRPTPSPQPYAAEPQQAYTPPQEEVGGPGPAVAEEKVEPEAEGVHKELTREELVNLRKDELIQIARDKSLKITGTKRDLIDRILGEEVED